MKEDLAWEVKLGPGPIFNKQGRSKGAFSGCYPLMIFIIIAVEIVQGHAGEPVSFVYLGEETPWKVIFPTC
jgi:hypothetical protein